MISKFPNLNVKMLKYTLIFGVPWHYIGNNQKR